MELLAATASGILYGALHGVGPDHCAALATLLAHEHGERRAVRVSLRFGLGHALALASLAALTTGMGWLIPESLETGAEIMGAGVLIALGVFALKRDFDLLAHRHGHTHDAGEQHEHWHVHVGSRHETHGHLHLATLTGGTLALSGVRALALALPPLLVAGQTWTAAGAFVLAFGLGVTASMIAVGLVLAATLRAGERSGNPAVPTWMRWSIGLGAIGIGVWWIWVRVAPLSGI